MFKCNMMLAPLCILLWLPSFISSQRETMDSNKVVKIGVFVDKDDKNAASINRTIDMAMQVSNKTKYVKMYPEIKQTDLDDSFKLRQTLCELAGKQTLSMLGTSKSNTINVIQAFSRTLRIPLFLLTLTRGPETDRDNFVINMCPSFIDAVIDFIKHMQWDRVFYLFDTDDGLWRLQKLYQAFNNPDRREDEQLVIDAVWIPNVTDCREILRRMDQNYNFDNKRIVVDLNSLHEYDIFMSQLIDVGMNRDGYHYLLGTLDIQGMRNDTWKSFKYGGVNITGFQLINKQRLSNIHPTVTNLLRDQQLSVEVALTIDATAVLTTAIVKIMRRPDHRTILTFRRGELDLQMDCSSNPIKIQQNGSIILEYIRNVTMDGTHLGLSGVIAFDEFGNRKGHSLDIYHLSYRKNLRQIGYWRNKKDGNILDVDIKPPPPPEPPKQPNRTRIVFSIMNEPFIQKRKSDNGIPLLGNERYEGFCIDMMKTLAEMVNFTYTVVLVNHSNYGSYNKSTKKWGGLIGAVVAGDADIALASLTITHQREEVVRFTKPFMNTGISIMIRKPEKEKPSVFSFMEPLSYTVWACIVCGFFAVSFVLYMVGRCSPYEWQDEGSDTAPSDTFSFINTLWFSLGALMQQGPDIFPRSLSGRVLGSAWWFFTLIIISSYTANLAAFLTFERLTTPINSADDLVKQSKIKYGTKKEGSTYNFFNETNVTTYEAMNKVMIDTFPDVYVEDEKAGWSKVCNEKNYAFLLESSSNMYYNQRKPCKTMKVGRNLDQKGYGIATPKTRDNIDFHELLNIAVLEMRERGDLLKLEQKWWYSKGECGTADGGEKLKSALNLSNVSGIFHILIGGLVLAMVISLSQIIFHAKIKPKRHKQETYRVSRPVRETLYKSPKRVTIEDHPPIITCTTSNGGEPHLIHFDDNSEDGIISLDREGT